MNPSRLTNLNEMQLENIAKQRITDYYRLNSYNKINDDLVQPGDRSEQYGQYQLQYFEVFDKYDVNLQIMLDLIPHIEDELRHELSKFQGQKENSQWIDDAFKKIDEDKLENLDVANHWTDDINKKLDQDINNYKVRQIDGISGIPKRNVINPSINLKLIEVGSKTSVQGKKLIELSRKLLKEHGMSDVYLKKFKEIQETLKEYQVDFFRDVHIKDLFPKGNKEKIMKLFDNSYRRSYDNVVGIFNDIIKDLDKLVEVNNDVILLHDSVVRVRSDDDDVNQFVGRNQQGGYRRMERRFT